MRNNNYNAGTATMTAEMNQALYGAGDAEGLGRQKLGLIVAGATNILSILILILDLNTTLFSADGVAEVIGFMLLGACMIGILASYFLTGFFRCLRRMGRLMFSGFYFPVWPINFFAGICTFTLVGVLALFFPLVIPALVYFEK